MPCKTLSRKALAGPGPGNPLISSALYKKELGRKPQFPHLPTKFLFIFIVDFVILVYKFHIQHGVAWGVLAAVIGCGMEH